jgi:uncharacterized membrane protein YfcA
MDDPLTTYLLLCLSAFGAGVVNAIAGGGTLLTFPTLLGVVSPVVANGTSTVALVPGSLASAWGYRRELNATRGWMVLLVGPSLVGGVVGSLLVTRLEEAYFKALIPWLILTAALLFLLQPVVNRLTRGEVARSHASAWSRTGAILFQFLVAVYGGYFGAGIGILMLSSLSLMGLPDIHEMNALKSFLAICINGVSVGVFVIEGKVAWEYALVMAGAAILGGYFGARLALLLRPGLVRWIVTGIGFGLAGYFFFGK